MTHVLEQILKTLFKSLLNNALVLFILTFICLTWPLPVLALDDCLSITCQVIYQFCDNGLGRCVECTEYCNLKKPWLLQDCNDTCPDFYSILMMTSPPYPATREAPTLITSQPPVTLQPKNDNLTNLTIILIGAFCAVGFIILIMRMYWKRACCFRKCKNADPEKVVTDAEILDSMLSKPIQETSQDAISSFPEQPDLCFQNCYTQNLLYE